MNALLAAAEEAGFLTTLVGGFDTEQRFALCVILMACLTATSICLGLGLFNVWARRHKQESETELKRDLLDRGRSAEDIRLILSATAAPVGVGDDEL